MQSAEPFQLSALGLKTGSLKTGTPVRIDARTVDFSVLTAQEGDSTPGKFSFSDTQPVEAQMPCFLAYTNTEVHAVLRKGFDRSPLFAGRIKGRGPRYCPSIEDKIDRFADKDKHQLFFEPCGRNTNEYYLNGFSSSLPEEVQIEALHKIRGFENARVFRPGYAIEYDFFDPQQLFPTLESRCVPFLYLAGQVNGTTGYEEAAGQGFMAGVNAHLKLKEREPFVLSRSQAYIGVLIDDLITKGVDEPYRMFTSRAEYRILLRQDNADQRLTPLSYKLGLAGEKRMERLESKRKDEAAVKAYLEQHKLMPEEANPFLEEAGTAPIRQKFSLSSLLHRPQIGFQELLRMSPEFSAYVESYQGKPYFQEMIEEAEISLKYDSYIKKEEENVKRVSRYESLPLRPDFDYASIRSLSFEAREKLSKLRPLTLGQASRIPGVSPSDISVLLVWLNK